MKQLDQIKPESLHLRRILAEMCLLHTESVSLPTAPSHVVQCQGYESATATCFLWHGGLVSFNQHRQMELQGSAESQPDHVSSRKSAAT